MKLGAVLPLAMLAGCAEAPEGSIAWLLNAPAQEIEVEGTPYRVLQRDDPNFYYAVHRDALGLVIADLRYVHNAEVAIETVSGCEVVDREVLMNIYIEALVDCSGT